MYFDVASRYTSPAMALSGHFWTVYPTLKHTLAPARAPEAGPWSTTVPDADLGTVTLTGALRDHPGSDTCLVVVHGLGGAIDGFYNVQAARAAERLGMSCLRLALRGADRLGEDFYHAGLVDDLTAALQSPALARYRHLLLIGYSLGGHMVLRWALTPSDARVRALVAMCAPLVLGETSASLDRPAARPYRAAVLLGLKQIYASVAARRTVPTDLAEVLRVRTLREWDQLTVVPRFGFDSVDDYYARMSVGPWLADLKRPALIVHSEHDPMIPLATYEHLTTGDLPLVTWSRPTCGGHVAFPQDVDLRLSGLARRAGEDAETQSLRWMLQQR